MTPGPLAGSESHVASRERRTATTRLRGPRIAAVGRGRGRFLGRESMWWAFRTALSPPVLSVGEFSRVGDHQPNEDDYIGPSPCKEVFQLGGFIREEES